MLFKNNNLAEVNLHINPNLLALSVETRYAGTKTCGSFALGQVLITAQRVKSRSNCYTLFVYTHIKCALNSGVKTNTITDHADLLVIVKAIMYRLVRILLS